MSDDATTDLPQRLTRLPRRPRLVGAEFLKLRKRRGLVLSTLALTVVPMIIAYTVLLILHAADAAVWSAGGLETSRGRWICSRSSVSSQRFSSAPPRRGRSRLRRLPGAGRHRALAAVPLRGPRARRTRARPHVRGGRLRRHGNGLDRVRGILRGAEQALVSSAAWPRL